MIWESEFFNILSIYEELDIFIPVLLDYLRGHVRAGNIVLVNKNLNKYNGVRYNIKENVIEIGIKQELTNLQTIFMMTIF